MLRNLKLILFFDWLDIFCKTDINHAKFYRPYYKSAITYILFQTNSSIYECKRRARTIEKLNF